MPSSTSNFRRHVAAFLAVGLSLSVALVATTEWMIRTKVMPSHNFTRYLALFSTSPSGNVVFGDSVAANGFSGAPGFINLALAGDNFAGMDKKIRFYFRSRSPDHVVVQAGLHHLSGHYTRYRDNGEAFIKLASGGGGEILKIFDPTFRFEVLGFWRTFLMGGNFMPRERFLDDGSRLIRDSYADYPHYLRHSAAGQLAQSWLPVANPETSPVMAEMRALLTELKGKGGVPCLVTWPVATEMREAMRAEPTFAQARSAFASLAAGLGIRYVELFDYEMPDAAFYNFTHSNQVGARQLAPLIVERCFG